MEIFGGLLCGGSSARWRGPLRSRRQRPAGLKFPGYHSTWLAITEGRQFLIPSIQLDDGCSFLLPGLVAPDGTILHGGAMATRAPASSCGSAACICRVATGACLIGRGGEHSAIPPPKAHARASRVYQVPPALTLTLTLTRYLRFERGRYALQSLRETKCCDHFFKRWDLLSEPTLHIRIEALVDPVPRSMSVARVTASETQVHALALAADHPLPIPTASRAPTPNPSA